MIVDSPRFLVVIPAKAGIQFFSGLVGTGPGLRRGDGLWMPYQVKSQILFLFKKRQVFPQTFFFQFLLGDEAQGR